MGKNTRTGAGGYGPGEGERSPLAPDPLTPAAKVPDEPKRLPTLGGPSSVASSEIPPTERISLGAGASALANSGASRGFAALDDLFGPDDVNDLDDLDDDDSPRLVVLHTYITGPGGGPYVRGRVISVLQLLGHNLMKDENRKQAKSELRRYLVSKDEDVAPAARLANAEEAKHDFITFPEGEQALESALDDANARADAERARADALETELRNIREGKGGSSSPAGTNTGPLLGNAGENGPQGQGGEDETDF